MIHVLTRSYLQYGQKGSLLHSLKLTQHLKTGLLKRKGSFPTINFHVRAVSFREDSAGRSFRFDEFEPCLFWLPGVQKVTASWQ